MAGALTWAQARQLAEEGKAIRRHGWERWLWLAAPRLWKVRFYVGAAIVERVAKTEDFGASEFAATDWTDEGWGGSLEEPTTPGPGSGDPGTQPGAGDTFPIERIIFNVDGSPVPFDVKARRAS